MESSKKRTSSSALNVEAVAAFKEVFSLDELIIKKIFAPDELINKKMRYLEMKINRNADKVAMAKVRLAMCEEALRESKRNAKFQEVLCIIDILDKSHNLDSCIRQQLEEKRLKLLTETISMSDSENNC